MNLLVILFIFLSIAFFTLLERKILSFRQNRIGPNKPSICGILLPLGDACKLFLKNIIIIPFNTFILSPFIAIFIMSTLWFLYFFYSTIYFYPLSFLFFICTSSLIIYPFLIAGITSLSKFSFLGRLRGLAQTISYEVSIVFIIFNMSFF